MYPKGLSSGTMDQIRNVEKMRLSDLTTYVKVNGKSLRKKIPAFDGIKIAPEKYLGSNHGREGVQRLTKDNKRKLSAAVVSRPQELGGGDVLLISSSNPTKNDWLLPKGGWDKGEDIQHAALREVIEEGGVRCYTCPLFRTLTTYTNL
ncbi:RxLR effector protein [Phytophthora megakarya]|uniref:RxLR effector protein n=1 Tax=Phytophthora megakarya TaxID=4795 RepID=A0A225W5G5_9STRA|nr:RxLR effector protein [Phytophthora megakarya]